MTRWDPEFESPRAFRKCLGMSSAPRDPPDPSSACALRQVVTRLAFLGASVRRSSGWCRVPFLPCSVSLLWCRAGLAAARLEMVFVVYLRPLARSGFVWGTGVFTFIVTWYVLTLSDTARSELRTPRRCRFFVDSFIRPPGFSVVWDDRTCL